MTGSAENPDTPLALPDQIAGSGTLDRLVDTAHGYAGHAVRDRPQGLCAAGDPPDITDLQIGRIAPEVGPASLHLLFNQLKQRHSVVGHRRLHLVQGCPTRTYSEDRR